MDLKTFLALLFVVVVIVVIGLSSSRFDKPSQLRTDAPGWADQLGELLLNRRDLEPADLAQNLPLACPDLFQSAPFVLDAGQTCAYAVVRDGGFRKSVRLLTLRASGGDGADVRFEPEDERLLPERYALGSRQTVEMSHDGGTLLFTCAGPGACSVSRMPSPTR